MTVLIGVLAGILYPLVNFGIFHLVCHSRSITEGYSLFLVLLWMSMSYGFTNFAWIWLWISKDMVFVVFPHFTVVVCLPAAFCDLQPCRYASDRHSAYNRGYHGYMAVILFLGYLALIVYNLWQREYAARINLVWLLAIGILVQFGWEAGLLLGGIRSAGFTAWEDKLRTLLVNSLLETNLGMPYIYPIYLAYSRRFTEQMHRKEQRISMVACIRENNGKRVRA